jgi:LysM repeat protein
VADDRAPKPAPRPRRRRTDIDPNAPTPPVANERRRRKTPVSQTEGAAAAASTSASETPVEAAPVDAAPVEAAPSFEAPPIDAPPIETAPVEEAVPAAPTDATQPFRVPHFDEPAAPPLVGSAVEPAIGEPVSTEEPAAVAAVTSLATATTFAPDEAPALDTDPGRAWLARLEDRSLDPNICPFLRATADGQLISPIEHPDPENRCAALNEAVPQSLRQQELVCLSSGHVNCPRYLRGSATATEAPRPVVRAGRTLTTPIFVSLVVLVMAVSASAAFVMARGGLVLSGSVASPSAAAVVPSASASDASPSVLATPSPSITPSPSTSPSLVPSDTPVPSFTPQPTATPLPTSDRYALLKPCPNTANCWIYTVRHGDNVFSIAHYFGVSTDSIYARNPWLKQTGLRAGQQLRLPPPTR